ncbi:MAG TPA: hypothetical protein VGL81_26685 [Polyangiaceae bacterium]
MAEEVPIAVYPAMLSGTIAGHFVGLGFDMLVLRSHSVWAPLACSVLLEALIGARYGAARVGHPLTASERGRLSIYYSLALVAVSLPLAVWLTASRHGRLPGVSVSSQDLVWVAIALVGLVVYTAARYGLMALFSPHARARTA